MRWPERGVVAHAAAALALIAQTEPATAALVHVYAVELDSTTSVADVTNALHMLLTNRMVTLTAAGWQLTDEAWLERREAERRGAVPPLTKQFPAPTRTEQGPAVVDVVDLLEHDQQTEPAEEPVEEPVGEDAADPEPLTEAEARFIGPRTPPGPAPGTPLASTRAPDVRRPRFQQILREHPDWSTSRLGAAAGVSQPTAARWRREVLDLPSQPLIPSTAPTHPEEVPVSQPEHSSETSSETSQAGRHEYAPAGHERRLDLGDAGHVTVRLDVDLFQLDDHQRAFVLELVALVRRAAEA